MRTGEKAHDRVAMDELISALDHAAEAGSAGLLIIGGQIPADAKDLARLLSCFTGLGLRWALWHHTDSIELCRYTDGDPVTGDTALLERMRLFGGEPVPTDDSLPETGGDLELRRDGELLRWRFVGAPAATPRSALADRKIAYQDFWAHHPDETFQIRRQTQLLWGEQKKRRNTEAPDQNESADISVPNPEFLEVEPDPNTAEKSVQQVVVNTAATSQPVPNSQRRVTFVDPRVGGACLNYPVDDDADRAEIVYLDIADAGIPAFNWWLEVRRHDC